MEAVDAQPEEAESSVRVVRVRRSRRRQEWLLPFARDLFEDHGLSDPALEAVANVAGCLSNERSDMCFRSEQGRVYLLQRGCVREDFPDGTARLWGRGALIGDWTRPAAGMNSTITVLSDTSLGLVFSHQAVQQLGAEHGQVLHALARMSMDRLNAAETVYGANRRSPVARLARLLLFLGSEFTYREEGRRRSTFLMDGVVRGPTQADFADALGLSRAAVEKAIVVLRECRALRKPEPGERRTNRLYVIANREALELVARGL